jgi:hypothetical protein
MSWKKVYWICTEEALTVRNRGGRNRALGTRMPTAIMCEPYHRWPWTSSTIAYVVAEGYAF